MPYSKTGLCLSEVQSYTCIYFEVRILWTIWCVLPCVDRVNTGCSQRKNETPFPARSVRPLDTSTRAPNYRPRESSSLGSLSNTRSFVNDTAVSCATHKNLVGTKGRRDKLTTYRPLPPVPPCHLECFCSPLQLAAHARSHFFLAEIGVLLVHTTVNPMHIVGAALQYTGTTSLYSVDAGSPCVLYVDRAVSVVNRLLSAGGTPPTFYLYQEGSASWQTAHHALIKLPSSRTDRSQAGRCVPGFIHLLIMPAWVLKRARCPYWYLVCQNTNSAVTETFLRNVVRTRYVHM